MTRHSSREATQLAGITYRELDYWTRTGRIKADPPDPGSGFPRTYDDAEIAIAKTAADLIKAGFDTDPALKTARQLHDTRHLVSVVAGDVCVTVGLIRVPVPELAV